MNVDFYILETTSPLKSWQFTCQLIEQRYQQKQSIYVAMASADELTRMDTLLWTFKDISFIPHVVDQDPHQSAPVIVGLNENTTTTRPPYDVFFNLSNQIPHALNNITTLIEIVFAQAVVQQSARERFRYYRDLGLTLNTIKA